MDYLVSQEKVMGANFSMEPLNRPCSRVFQVDLWDHIKGTEFLKKVETLNLSDSGFKAIAKGHIYDII